MKKLKTLILAAFTTLSVSLVAPLGSQSVQAATWHKGTPKALRGTWQRTEHVSGKYGFSFKSGIRFQKSHSTTLSLGDPFVMNHLKYKKVGKTAFVLSGIEYLYSKTYRHIKVIKHKNKIKWRCTAPKSYSYHYSKWLYK